MNITSPAFTDQAAIPPAYTCDGQNTSPELRFDSVPEAAVSLALIMYDPDVPKTIREDGLWVHWVLWNISPSCTGIAANSVPSGAIVGRSTSNVNAYGGPCPPDGEHRYFFVLYALDTNLTIPPTSSKQEVETAVEGHVIETAQLMGVYTRVQST